MDKMKTDVKFAAINQYVTSNIVLPTEKDIKKEWISWGERNDYPNYIETLFKECSVLHSIITGMVDYICGDAVTINHPTWSKSVNDNGDNINDIVRQIALSYAIYGGFAINVLRNKLGGVAQIYVLDFKNVRSDKKNTAFYYSSDWGVSAGRVKCTRYPKFEVDSNDPSSILYCKNQYYTTYPAPMYSAATKSCEIQKLIGDYHLNNLHNNFSGGYIVNFNNGIPEESIQEEIEDNFNDKFTGVENSGRIMLSWNNSKDNATTIEKIATEDWGTKYESLMKSSRQEIFTAFRATPNLFAIPTENNGFSAEEYDQAFKLFNRTTIRPIQSMICDTFDKLLGEHQVMTIKPFSIDFSEDADQNNVVK